MVSWNLLLLNHTDGRLVSAGNWYTAQGWRHCFSDGGHGSFYYPSTRLYEENIPQKVLLEEQKLGPANSDSLPKSHNWLLFAVLVSLLMNFIDRASPRLGRITDHPRGLFYRYRLWYYDCSCWDFQFFGPRVSALGPGRWVEADGYRAGAGRTE